jgi:hypothetical protein
MLAVEIGEPGSYSVQMHHGDGSLAAHRKKVVHHTIS